MNDLQSEEKSMTLLTYSVVRRHMKNTSGFTLCDEGSRPPLNLRLADGESVIGWYRNPTPWESSLLVFTSTAIWTVEGGAAERIALADIVGYESPGTKELAAYGSEHTTVSGSCA